MERPAYYLDLPTPLEEYGLGTGERYGAVVRRDDDPARWVFRVRRLDENLCRLLDNLNAASAA